MQLLVLLITIFISVYILLLYVIDACLRWRHTDHSVRYFVLRSLSALLFLCTDIILLIESKRMLAAFYGVQGLSLLLNFIIQVMMSSRSALGTFSLDSFRKGLFPWILLAFVLAVLGFACTGFIFILFGYHSALGLKLVAAGNVLTYGSLGSLTIVQLHRSGVLGSRHERALGPLCISGINVIALPVSVLFLCWHDMAIFFLAENIVSSAVSTSWIVMTSYKLENSSSDMNEIISHIEG